MRKTAKAKRISALVLAVSLVLAVWVATVSAGAGVPTPVGGAERSLQSLSGDVVPFHDHDRTPTPDGDDHDTPTPPTTPTPDGDDHDTPTPPATPTPDDDDDDGDHHATPTPSATPDDDDDDDDGHHGTPTPTSVTRVKFEGTIESMGETEWEIGGYRVLLTQETKIVEHEGAKAEVGAQAMVIGSLVESDTVVADVIKVEHSAGVPGPKGEFRGPIEEIGDGYWVVRGTRILITTETEIEGMPPAVGLIAEVEARYLDGQWVALEIEVSLPDREEVEFEGVLESLGEEAWVVSGITVTVSVDTRIYGDPQVGATVEVEALIMPDESLLAIEIHVENERVEVEFEGMIESIGPDQWVVGGTTCEVNAETFIDESEAVARVGLWAEVEAVDAGGGRLVARKIHVERPKLKVASGVVAGLDAGEQRVDLELEDGELLSLYVVETTYIVKGGETATFADLALGDVVDAAVYNASSHAAFLLEVRSGGAS